MLEYKAARYLKSVGVKYILKPDSLVLLPRFETLILEYPKETNKKLKEKKKGLKVSIDKARSTREFGKDNKKEMISSTILPITWAVDYFLPDYNISLEMKGVMDSGFPNKLKLAQYVTHATDMKIAVAYSIKDLEDLIHYLKNN